MYDEAASLGGASGGAGGEEKAHFWLGHFHDGVLRKALQSAARAEVVVPGGQAAQRSCPSKRVVSSSERQKKALDAYKKLLPAVLRHYGQALRRGSKYAPQALPRLLTLWLDSADLLSKCGQEGEREGNKLHEAMETLVNKTVPAALDLPRPP